MPFHPPPPLPLAPLPLSDLARRSGLMLRGPDREIGAFDYIDAAPHIAPVQLTFAASAAYLARCAERGIAACVTTAELAPIAAPGLSVLVAKGDPADDFYSLFAALASEGRWQAVPSSRGRDVTIAATAVVHDSVSIGDGCRIMDHAVLLPNTRLGDRVVVKPGAVIGGDGLEVRRIDGRRRVVPHVGGVWLEDDVEIGSQTCVDRGLFGEFTFVGAGSKIDNLVHVAHRVTIGPECTVVACAEVSGSVTLGAGGWLGPNPSVNQQLHLGDFAFIGTGSVVTRSLGAHALAFGSPARQKGWICRCRKPLEVLEGGAVCPACGASFVQVGEALQERAR